MRVDNLEDRLADLGKLVVDLEMHARGEKGERLDESLDVWILALVRFEQQPPSDLGVTLGELRAHTTDVGELALVVVQQLLTHRASPRHRSRRSRNEARR